MIKHQKKISFLFLIIFIFTPFFSYAFMTVTPTNNLDNIHITEGENDLGSTENNVAEEGLVSDNLIPEKLTQDGDEPEIQLFKTEEEIVIPEKTKEVITEEKTEKTKIKSELFKESGNLEDQSLKKGEKEVAVPNILKMPQRIDEEKEKTKEEVKKELKKKTKLRATFGAEDIRKEISRNPDSVEVKNRDEIMKKIIEAHKKNEQMMDFANSIDIEKSKEAIEKNRERIEKDIAAAVVNMRKEKILESCKKNYLSIIDSRIAYIYNMNKVYVDRGDKLMIAFSLLKEGADLHPMVQSAMNEMNYHIKENGEENKFLMEDIYKAREELKNVKMYSRNTDICRDAKVKYKKTMYYVSLLSGAIRNQEMLIRRMKLIINEFTKEDSFNDAFLLDLACIYDHDYVDSLPMEQYHYCNRDENRFYK